MWMECFLGAHDQYQLGDHWSANDPGARRSRISSYQIWRCSLIISICTTNGIQSIGNLSNIIKSKIWSFFQFTRKLKNKGKLQFQAQNPCIHTGGALGSEIWDLRSWIWGSEIWDLGSEFWVLRSEIWELGSEIWDLRSESWDLRSGSWGLRALAAEG